MILPRRASFKRQQSSRRFTQQGAQPFPMLGCYSNYDWFNQFFTSKRRMDDQAPGFPEASLARTRHHIVSVGKVLVLNWETVVFCWRIKGEGKELLSSI
jgi:hypothetical protein